MTSVDQRNFYVYEWYDVNTGDVIYVGKGIGKRYRVRKHNRLFNDYIATHECSSRIVCEFESEDDAFAFEETRVNELWAVGQASCNIYRGGRGGTTSWWDDEHRTRQSQNNGMHSDEQKARMSAINPMHDNETSANVGRARMRAVVIDGVTYESAKSAAESNGVCDITIRAWCKAGVSSDGRECRYLDGKPTKRHVIGKYERKLSKLSRAVVIDGVRYESTAAAARHFNTCVSAIKHSIRNGGRYKGLRCEYATK